MKNKLKLWLISLLNIVLYVFGTEILTYFLITTKPHNNILLNLYLLLSPLIITIILLIINRKELNNCSEDKNIKYNLKLTIKYYLCGLILMILTNMIITTLMHSLPVNEEGNREIISKLPIYSIFSMVLFAPLNEEICFRLGFKNIIKNKQTYLITTALIFGLLHVIFNGDYIFIIPYAALGYFLGKIYYETGNIAYSFLTHAFHNALCLMMIFIEASL